MNKMTKYQIDTILQIEQRISVAMQEVNTICPNKDCKKCELESDCPATYSNRMKAMFLKGAICGTFYPQHQTLYDELLKKLTNHG